MNYIDGVTGQILTENSLIKNNTKNITVDGDAYQMMRTLLYISNPSSYADNSTVNAEGGIMTFYTDEEYDATTKIMKKLGIKFKDSAINNAKDDKNNNPEVIPSPYPSNKEVKKNRVY